jgi:peptidylprolyl isomerase
MHAFKRRIALALGAAVALCTLASCGNSSAPSGALPTVSGAFGATPTITFPSSGPPSTLKSHVLTAGHGPVVLPGQLLVANYLGQIWKGKVFDSSFKRHVASSFPIGLGRVIPGWDKSLVGAHAGTRLLLVVPPADGYGPKGQASAGITGTDTLVFVVDVVASYSSTATGGARTGTLHSTVGGVTVTWPASHPPVVHVAPGTVAPTKATVSVISGGKGRRIAPGLVVLQYVVVDPKTNKVVDSTWKTGFPDGEITGDPATPSVLDHLIGVSVGSRLILWLPKSSSGGPYVFAIDVVAQPSLLTH